MSVQQVATIGPRPGTDPEGTGILERQLAEITAPASLPRPAGRVAEAPALQVADLHKDFRSGFLRRRLRGIAGISFSVTPGTIFALLGHNGAGKTTTINCILDLVRPDNGTISILGHPHDDPRTRARIGYLPERPYFFEHLSGRELLAFYADLLGVPRADREGRIDRCLELVRMQEFGGRRLSKYSKGMLQRIGLAQTLLGDPELLILDEPMSGLDPLGRREVRELLLDLRRQGKTIILSSHIVPDIEMLADEVAVLQNGRLVATRSLAQLSQGTGYRVNLACSPDGSGDDLAGWRWRREGDVQRVEAGPVDALRELLDHCHRGGRTVLSVDTVHSGLEDLFLRLHEQEEIAR
ncbi:MAG: ATP-binding cassette domain-containing protein [Candidatus Krumholzibacteriia bacterium]